MLSIARHLFYGASLFAAAVFVTGCSSEDSGDTLSVQFTTAQGVGLSLTTAGVYDNPSTPADESKPDVYTGKGVLVAKVIYHGKKTLVYKWTVGLPSNIGATIATSSESVSLDMSASTIHGAPLGSGTGDATLEVYEKDGTQYKKATTEFPVVVGFSG